jgi:hypothetical protein
MRNLSRSLLILAAFTAATGSFLISACVAEKRDANGTDASGGASAASGAPGTDAGGDAADGSPVGSGGGGSGGTAGDAGVLDGDVDGSDAGDPVLDVLGNPHVKDALDAASTAGYPITTHAGRTPPAIGGYLLKPPGVGRFVASGNGANLNSGVLGNESRVTVHDDDTVTEALVSFSSQGEIFGSAVITGYLLRGADDAFTLYRTYQIRCQLEGANRIVDLVNILTGRLEAASGDWVSTRQISVAIAATGDPTAACDQLYVGDTEVPGGWYVADVPRHQSITVAELGYMCVDADAGYIAGETWTRGDGTACSCSADFVVECG